MAITISLFNHKGGVSKTTTAFNLGWMIASKGKRVLLVDCDPQCNLTGMVLGFKGITELEKFYKTDSAHNIRDGLAPAFESRPSPIIAVSCEEVSGQPNLFLLPGHIGLAEYEVTLGIAQELSGSLPTLRNLPGAISYLLNETSEFYNIDYTIVDMSPSLGPLNQNLLMVSDFFLVPMNPDYFSAMAIDSLASVLPKWRSWAVKAQQLQILQDANYPFPIVTPKFLGTIIQRYRLRSGLGPAKAFQNWIDEIETGVKDVLVPALRLAEMLLPLEVYARAGFAPEQALLKMSDFNSLIASSQKYQVPVFNLTDAQLEQVGVVLENTRASMVQFRKLFSDAADRVIGMTEHARGDRQIQT
jgi:cellulose biosynthesis protein BcsQ